MIVVIPDGTFNADGGGFYTNWVDQKTSRGVANWETFHTQELVKWTDRRFRTIDNRTGRGIVGISQGGFGSMSYAARHSQTYGAAASFSGATSIYYNPICQVGATLLVSTIMTALNGVQPFAPFGDPVTNAANWKSRDPATIVKNLAKTNVEIYTSSGKPSNDELLHDPAVLGTSGLEALLHVSNKCFKQAADKAGITYGWHEYAVGTHAWMYGDRSLKDYLPRLTKFFEAAKR
jgi:S-formylglutathione hydrolase FrmB